MALLFRLPTEVLLKIVSLLELNDVARIRQSCKQLQVISQDKPVWGALLADQRLKYPVPPWLNLASSSPSISQTDLERAVLAVHRVARAWPQSRPAPFRVQPRQGDMLLWIEMFLDRWLLVIYAEGLAYLWDTMSDPMAPPGSSGTNSRTKICAKLADDNENRLARWTSCAAQLSNDGQKLIVLLNMRPTGPKPYCCVYEVSLKAYSSFKLLATVRLGEPEIIRTMSLDDNILILSRGSAINLVDINSKPYRDILVLSPYSDDLEDMWNAAIEVRLFNRYIFVFKARSFEVHNMDSLLNTDQREVIATPISQHPFQNATFREVKISDPTIVTINETLDVRFQVFAYDVLQGLFRYSVWLRIHPEQPPHFIVTLSEIYPLTDHVVSQYSRLLPEPDLLTPSPTPTNEAGHAFRSVTNPSSRGFVSAYAIGSQGRRALWVERVRGSTMREIHVWSLSGPVDYGVVQDKPPKEMQRFLVFSVASPDLREDITRCALSESMGLIVLGNRAGELFLLDVGV